MASLPDARLTDSDMPAVVKGERSQMHYGGIDVRIQGNSSPPLCVDTTYGRRRLPRSAPLLVRGFTALHRVAHRWYWSSIHRRIDRRFWLPYTGGT